MLKKLKRRWPAFAVLGIIVAATVVGNAVAANLTTTPSSGGRGLSTSTGFTASDVTYVTTANSPSDLPALVSSTTLDLKRVSDGTGASTVTSANTLAYAQLETVDGNSNWTACAIGAAGATTCSFTGNTLASAGSLDATFNTGGTVGMNNYVYDFAVQPDGKIVVSGLFTTARGTTQNYIARLNTDGSLDTGFNTGGTVGMNGIVSALAVQPDGKIVVGGFFTTARGVTQNRIARLNTDGSLDTSFNVGGTIGVDGTYVWDLALQSDGKIVIGGSFTAARGTTQNYIARLNTDGSLDTGFNTGGTVGMNGTVFAVAVQSDGKVIVGGNFTTARGTTQNYIARLNTDGSLDTGFNTGGTVGVNAFVEVVAVQSDGKVIVGGNFTTARGTTQNYIARLNTDGSLDTGFNTGGTVGVNGLVHALAVQPDGQILIGGNFTTARGFTQNHVARLDGGAITTSSIDKVTGVNIVAYDKV